MAAPIKKPTGKPKVQAPQTPMTQLQQAGIRKFMIIAIGGTALVVLIGGYFIYQLANQNVLKANEIKAQDIYIGLSKTKLKVLADAEVKMKELKTADSTQVSDFSRITERVLPSTDDLGVVLTIFQKLETDTLVKIENIGKNIGASGSSVVATAPVASSGPTSAKSFSIAFKATGKYDLMQKFLKAIEGSQRVFDFTNLKISGSTEALTLDMTYKLYYLEKPGIGDSTIPLSDYKPKGVK